VFHRLAFLLAPVLGCARPSAPATVAEAEPSCVLASPAAAGDTVRLVLAESVTPDHAPRPTNDAEALVFRQLYETLVRMNCEGNPVAGLAVAWRDAGTQWTFTLRPDASFEDGHPLDATTVLEEWRATDRATAVTGVRSDGRTLTVFLSAPRPIEYFADPALSVVRRIPERSWPLGTSAWTLPPAAASGSALTLVAAGAARSVMRFDHRPGADARDALDAGTAVLLTRDPAAIAYAASLREWIDAPLEWDRWYLLFSRATPATDTAALAAIRTELARDVVRGDARPANAESIDGVAGCGEPVDSGTPVRPPRRLRLVYPRDDPVARRLAERLTARAERYLAVLAGWAGGAVTAAGLSTAGVDSALAAGDDWAVLLPVGSSHPGSCGPGSAVSRDYRVTVPLVETRPHALLRPGSARIVRDRAGVVIEPPVPRR
jgi:hypothetical protein